MTTTRIRNAALTLTAVCLLAVAANCAHAQSYASRNVIERNAKVILKWAHPTVKLSYVNYTCTRSAADGYTVQYRFHFRKGFSGKYSHTDLTFVFNRFGTIQDVYGRTPGFWQPGDGAELTVAFLKNRLRNTRIVQENETLRRFVDRASARGLLILYLRIAG